MPRINQETPDMQKNESECKATTECHAKLKIEKIDIAAGIAKSHLRRLTPVTVEPAKSKRPDSIATQIVKKSYGPMSSS